MSAVLSLHMSVYLCVLCVKYIGANDLTQSTQRYTEIRRETRTANEPTLRAEPNGLFCSTVVRSARSLSRAFQQPVEIICVQPKLLE
jgi:hypothetical protein